MVPAKLKLPIPFDQILVRHEREIMRYLLRVLDNRDDAADLFQETWLRAYRAYPKLEAGSDVRPWLYAIAVNLCRNRARDGARRARVIADEGRISAAKETNKTPVLSGNDGYAAVRLREFMVSLPARQREALRLRYFAGLDYTGIAVALGCSEESARANVSQAMKKIKSMW